VSDPAAQAQRARVDAVFDALLDHLVDASPLMATYLGDHRRDADLDDWSPGEADRRLATIAGLRAELAAVGDIADPQTAGDATMLNDALDATTFELGTLREPERDPLFFLGIATAAVDFLIRRDDLPAPPRAEAVAGRVAQVPRLLQQARATLNEIPAPHRELALLRIPGAMQLFDAVVPAFAPQAAEAGAAAARACQEFGTWLDEQSRPAPDWRLGEALWADALRLALGVRMAPEELWRRAEQRLAVERETMERLASTVLGADAKGLRGPELVRAGVAAASADHPPRAELVREAAAVLDGVKDFIRAHGEFPLPDPDALRVEEVPPFMQGAVVAYFMAAPALEPEAAHTYYLSPVPDDWEPARAASFLREYNRHALQSVGIHEAYPGHYVQQAFANAHPRLLRRVLWNSAFAEGWAVYVERRLVAAGFGGDGAAGDRLKLISAKMALRTMANALLDQGMHTRGWSDEQALELMVDQTYQEHAEAQAKLLRAKTTAGQLSTYFVGSEEMDDLRRDVEAARGAAFDAARFHADVLAEGTPPFPALRRALLKEA
jgi:uncharacterized protein (DUF885 family)